jgi:hypothetical protein
MSAFFGGLTGRAWLFAALLVTGAWPAAADPMLTLSNAEQPGVEVELTEAELLAMPQATIRTSTIFTDGVVEFTGPRAREGVDRMPAGVATTVHMVAINDDAYDLPLSDLSDYNVILAMTADGKRLSIRDKGPLWVMYPLDDHPELKEQKYNLRLVWQLRHLQLR